MDFITKVLEGLLPAVDYGQKQMLAENKYDMRKHKQYGGGSFGQGN